MTYFCRLLSCLYVMLIYDIDHIYGVLIYKNMVANIIYPVRLKAWKGAFTVICTTLQQCLGTGGFMGKVSLIETNQVNLFNETTNISGQWIRLLAYSDQEEKQAPPCAKNILKLEMPDVPHNYCFVKFENQKTYKHIYAIWHL